MDAIIKATLYTAKSSYPNVFHRFNTPFTGSAPSMDGDEKAFLCSMSRMHFEDANMRTWFEKYLASVLGRTATEIHDAMSKKSCKK